MLKDPLQRLDIAEFGINIIEIPLHCPRDPVPHTFAPRVDRTKKRALLP